MLGVIYRFRNSYFFYCDKCYNRCFNSFRTLAKRDGYHVWSVSDRFKFFLPNLTCHSCIAGKSGLLSTLGPKVFPEGYPKSNI